MRPIKLVTSSAFLRVAQKHSQRARRYGVENTLTRYEIEDQYIRQDGRCYWCKCEVVEREGESCMTVDHLVSMCKGGGNTAENIVIACHRCNLKKNRTPADKFAESDHQYTPPEVDYSPASLTGRARSIYEALQASGIWMTRTEIAKARGRKQLDGYEVQLLYRMEAFGLIEIRRAVKGRSGYQYRSNQHGDGG